MSSTSSASRLVGRPLSSLPSPAFVVDLLAVRANCARMLSRAEAAGVQLRGHAKTHKTVEAAVVQTGGTKRWVGDPIKHFFYLLNRMLRAIFVTVSVTR